MYIIDLFLDFCNKSLIIWQCRYLTAIALLTITVSHFNQCLPALTSKCPYPLLHISQVSVSQWLVHMANWCLPALTCGYHYCSFHRAPLHMKGPCLLGRGLLGRMISSAQILMTGHRQQGGIKSWWSMMLCMMKVMFWHWSSTWMRT